MPLIELIDYTLAPAGTGNGLSDIYFSLSQGESCSIHADYSDDATLFLKALATLVSPIKGTYCFNGEKINFSHYRHLLPYKRRIGYIAPDSAMISNRTVYENLLFMRCFYENSLQISLDDHTKELCRKFDILDKIDMKPTELHPQDIQNAITIRELCKSPDLLLIERPEDFVDYTKFNLFSELLKELSLSKLAIVFFTFDKLLESTLSNKKVLISKGYLNTTS